MKMTMFVILFVVLSNVSQADDVRSENEMPPANNQTVEQKFSHALDAWSPFQNKPENWPYHLPSDSKLSPVDKSSPYYKELLAVISKVEQGYVQSNWIGADMSLPKSITGPGISKVFPDHHFFAFRWSERSKDPKRPVIGLMGSAHASIGISKKGDVTIFGGGLIVEEFGKYLRNNHVKITNVEDARNVLEAFCEIYRRDWKASQVEKVSDTVWRIGVRRIKTRQGSQNKQAIKYCEVQLNEDLSVKSMKSCRTIIE